MGTATPIIRGRAAMLDDFFVRALLAGVGAALVAGPLGCFVVWRRMAYFGDTLSHASLLGVAVALLADINVTVAVFAVAVLAALLLVVLQRRATLSADSLLGLLAHSALALGLVALGFLTWVRVDLSSYLFGDILAVSAGEVATIWIGGAAVLAVLAVIWRPLFAATVSRELAEAEGAKPDRTELIYILLMATVIALSIKIVGVLLITAMLIVPAAAARRLASGPEHMAVLAAAIGAAAAVAGLFGSLEFDTPAGPSIVVAALGLFIVSMLLDAGRAPRGEGGTSR